MKVLDVDLLQDGLTRNINRMNRLEKEMTAIQKAVEELTAMEEALKGEGGQAIRDFYTSCHLPFLQYFLTFKEEFSTVLQQAQQALVSLEPMDAGHIVEEFLETKVEEGLTESANVTATLTDEANAIMDEVSDIVSLPKLDDTLVQESVADAKTKRDDTVEALHTFDSTQTNQLVPIETSIQSMKEWVQNIEGLFKEGLTDVNFPTDKWSSIAGNSAIVMSLAAKGMETGIDSQEVLACERPVETDVKEDRAWYKVVGDVLIGIAEGVAKAIADIFTGLFDLLKNLFTDPIGFFGGLATAIMNPIDTFSQMWSAVEAAWERDVINGDARSRASFFSYTLVSVVGLKGVDKLGKAGKLGTAASKADNSLPYNAMKTDALKNTLKTNVQAVINEKTKQAAAFWNSKFSKEAINNTIQAVKNSAVITKAKNTLDPANIKAAAAKTYDDVVKTPIAKTQAAMKEKKEQLLDMPLPNFGLSPVFLGPGMNMTVREGIEAAKDTVVRIVGDKDGGGEKAKGTVKDVTFKKGYDTHLTEVEGFKAKPNIGIKGGHNLENFEQFILDNFGNQVKDINQAVTKTPHPDISGIYEVKYKLPVYDGLSKENGGKGNFTGQWKEYKNPKTVYDPKVFSDEQILKLGREAMEEGISNNRIIQGGDRSPSDMVEGYVNVNGKQLKFMGFKDKNTGEISNFFPVLD